MKGKWEIILAGSGGQGLGLAGQIFAEAAMLETNCLAAHNQSFGGRARGGASQSSLILSCEEILYPIVTCPDLLIALTQQAYLEYQPQVSDTGIIVYDSSQVKDLKNRVREVGFPFLISALEMGNSKGITLMAIGAANELLKIVSPHYFHQALELHFSNKLLELNKEAFDRGHSLVTDKPHD